MATTSEKENEHGLFSFSSPKASTNGTLPMEDSSNKLAEKDTNVNPTENTKKIWTSHESATKIVAPYYFFPVSTSTDNANDNEDNVSFAANGDNDNGNTMASTNANGEHANSPCARSPPFSGFLVPSRLSNTDNDNDKSGNNHEDIGHEVLLSASPTHDPHNSSDFVETSYHITSTSPTACSASPTPSPTSSNTSSPVQSSPLPYDGYLQREQDSFPLAQKTEISTTTAAAALEFPSQLLALHFSVRKKKEQTVVVDTDDESESCLPIVAQDSTKTLVPETFPNNSDANSDDNDVSDSNINISNDATFEIDINHTSANSAEETGDNFSQHIDNLAAELKAEMQAEYGLLQEIIQGEATSPVHGSGDKGKDDVSPNQENSPPKAVSLGGFFDDNRNKGEAAEHWSSRMEALESELSASRERVSQLARQLQQKELRWFQQTQYAEKQLQAQQDLVRQQYNLQVQELQEQHETELELLQNHQEALLVESTGAAARVMEQSRQHVAAMKDQLAQERCNFGAQLKEAVQQATQAATDTTMKSAYALLQQQADEAAANKLQDIEVEAIQATCNALEAELGDAFCQMEQLQTERNDSVANLQVEITDLQSRLRAADQELQRLQLESEAHGLLQENWVTAQSRMAELERERDDAEDRASRFDTLVTMIEEETKLEREQYLSDLETERSASTLLRNEMEQLREVATGQVVAVADDRDRRIQLLALVQSCWAHAQAESEEQLDQGRRDSNEALQELQLRMMSNAAGKDEDEDEYTAEMVALFRAIRLHSERQQELALANLSAGHCNEMAILNEARLADMVDLFHVCQKSTQTELSTSNDSCTQASSTSLGQVMAQAEPPALVASNVKPQPEPSVASDETDGDAFVSDESPKESIDADSKKGDVPSCQESVGISAAVKGCDGGATEHVPTTLPLISVKVVYVPVEQKSDLQSPTSAFAPYRRTHLETEAQTAKFAVDDSSVAPHLEPSSKHQVSSAPPQAVQPTVEATTKKPAEQAGAKFQQTVVEAPQTTTPTVDDMSKTAQPDPKHKKLPTKRESALRRPTSLAAPVSRSSLRTPLRTKSLIPSKEDTGSDASRSGTTGEKVKRKPALSNFSSSVSQNERQQVRVSVIGKHSERASVLASALPSHAKRNEPKSTLSGVPSRKTATNRVGSQIGGKKTPAAPAISRLSGLQNGTKSSIRKKTPVTVDPAPSRTSSAAGTLPSRAGKIAGRATPSSTSRIGTAATSRIGKPAEKTRSLLPKYGGVKRPAGGIVAPSSSAVRSTAKASAIKTPLNSTRYNRGSTSTPSSSAQPKQVDPRSSARSTKPASSFSGSNSASVQSKATTKSPSSSRSKADRTKDGIVSPKELISNVLKTLSPSPKSVPSPKAVLDESIDETPREVSSHQVKKKFQSLFTDWSTAKKSPHPRNNSTQDMDELPSSLFADWSTKKHERPKSNEVLSLCKRQKQAEDTSNLDETIGPVPVGLTSPAVSNPSLVSPVAVKPGSYFCSSFSPEELLVSPTPVSRQGGRYLSHIREATRIQTCFRAQCARKSYHHQHEVIVKLQTFVRASFVRREARAAKTTARAAKAALNIRIQEATRIQTCFRTQCARKSYHHQHEAIVKLQTFVRASFVRREVRAVKTSARAAKVALDIRIQEATRIQTCFRTQCARKSYNHQHEAIVKLQTFARASLVRREVREAKTAALAAKAALGIQAFWRGSSVRKARKDNTLAVSVIQTYAPKMLQSQTLKTKDVRNSAAQCLQTRWRAKTSKESFDRTLKTVTMIQSEFRRVHARASYVSMKKSCFIIQKIVRESLSRRCVTRRRNAALTIQRSFRGFSSRRGLELRARLVITNSMRIQHAALTIQCNIRASLARRHFIRVRSAARTIQRNVRGFSSRRGLELFQSSALTIQCSFREFSSRRGLEMFQSSALTIQRSVRSILARRKFVRVQHAALAVQRSARSSLARRKFMRVQHATLTIQRHSRGALHRDKYASVLLSVLALQRVARGHCARSHARQLVANDKSAICIQKQWRGSTVRISIMVSLTSSIRIQALVRGSSVRAEAKMANQWFKAAVCLQRYLRGSLIRSDFVFLRDSAILIQAIARGSSARLKATKLTLEASAARSLQIYWRGSRARTEYNAKRESAILIQSIMRRAGARVYFNTILASTFDKSANNRMPRGKLASTKKQVKKPDGDKTPLKPGIAEESVSPGRQEASKLKRKPFGDFKGSAAVSSSTRKSSRKVVTDTYNEENMSNANAENEPRKSSRKVVSDTHEEENMSNAKVENDTEIRCAIEKLKVVELKLELTGYGIENKALRNIRKAELVDMCLSMRTQPQSA